MSSHTPPGTSPSADDIGELYCVLARRLEDIVRLDVSASDSVVEDACQFAWVRLLAHRARVHREAVIAWLTTTAVREALRLVDHQRRHLSLEDVAVLDVDLESPGRNVGPEELVLQHERLDSVAALPRRQQEMLWLQALGLSYAEIAVYTRSSVRTVERQLLRAKQAARASPAEPAASPTPAALRREARTARSVLAA
jgi:RNA polymerase sigma factor (sigma-70 family)